MSASREKKGRQAPVSANSEQTNMKSKNKLAAILTAVVVFVLIAAVVFVKGPFLRKMTTAVKVGDHELNGVMVRYYYSENFNNFLSSYGDLASYLFPDNQNIEKQIFDEETGETWGDYFMNSAMEQIKVTYAVYDEALKNGFSLPEKDEDSIQSTMNYIKMSAKTYDVTEKAFVEGLYGPGSDLKSFNEYLHVTALANAYQESVKNSFSYSDEEINAQYELHPESYNAYNYHSYYISGVAGEDADAEEEMAKAESSAKTILEAANAGKDYPAKLDNFLLQVSIVAEDDSYLFGQNTLHSNTLSEDIDESYRDWVTDANRKEGDVETFLTNDSGYTAVLFVSSDNNDYATVDARIVPITVQSDDEDGWANALEQKNAMEKDIEAVEEWNEDIFMNLALAYSDDEETMYSGGKFEAISKKNAFNPAVSDWLFREDRKVGDHEILPISDGYVFVYFEGEGENYRDVLIDNDLRGADYENWYLSATDVEEPVQIESGMKHVVKELSYSLS